MLLTMSWNCRCSRWFRVILSWPPKLSFVVFAITSAIFIPKCRRCISEAPLWKRFVAESNCKSTVTSASTKNMRPRLPTMLESSTANCKNIDMTSLPFPIVWVRDAFPALQCADRFVFFDNAAGAQIPQNALDAVRDHLISRNVQRGGRYGKSREVDEAIQRARETVAMFLNAREPDEIGRA